MLHKLVCYANRWCYLGLLSVLLILTACAHQGENLEQATFVVFYEPVHNHYAYTKIGYLENPDGLKQAVGSGDVQFHLQIK